MPLPCMSHYALYLHTLLKAAVKFQAVGVWKGEEVVVNRKIKLVWIGLTTSKSQLIRENSNYKASPCYERTSAMKDFALCRVTFLLTVYTRSWVKKCMSWA